MDVASFGAMNTIAHVEIGLCDVLNPRFGYQIRVTDDDGETLLFTSLDPVTGRDLLTYSDALRVACSYATPSESTDEDYWLTGVKNYAAQSRAGSSLGVGGSVVQSEQAAERRRLGLTNSGKAGT
jgi:hypothetical protein